MKRGTKMSINRQNTIAVSRTDWHKPVLLISLLLVIFSLLMMTWSAVRAETIEAGNLNGKALSLLAPVYPPLAKQMHITGMIKVDVVVSESGKVETAKVASGSAMLRQPAVDAALKAKFAPTLKAGAPVKVAGFLQYDFKLD